MFNSRMQINRMIFLKSGGNSSDHLKKKKIKEGNQMEENLSMPHIRVPSGI